ncbi:hypothetical protein GE09DRAFT_98456 [Coniochaeta sp. 2T2.1]|nr:hypothetical protein GE09DRAFT_98456 [Coniochaeta sp. 2T2.1]
MPHRMETRSNTRKAKWKREYLRKMKERGDSVYSCPYCLRLDEQVYFDAMEELVRHIEASGKGARHDELKAADGWGTKGWDVVDDNKPTIEDECQETSPAEDTTDSPPQRPVQPSIETMLPTIETGDRYTLSAVERRLEDSSQPYLVSPTADIQPPFDYRASLPSYWQGVGLELPISPVSEMEFRSGPQATVIRDRACDKYVPRHGRWDKVWIGLDRRSCVSVSCDWLRSVKHLGIRRTCGSSTILVRYSYSMASMSN